MQKPTNAYSNCFRCKKGFECGWSFLEPRQAETLDRAKMVDEPCENFCEPSNFTADDIDDDTAIDLLAAVVKQARLDDDTKFLDKLERSFENDRKRVVKSWVSP